ncbi:MULTISPECIES: hypothetical protein [Campylobacter]|uniref:Lipoprotein, beta-barrel assembly machinery complex lipoprotein BamB n=1 Tax=Campylobacter porcelli TaxID=1660073 RepID=A0A1X9SXS4_9BACT|nr:MULTISPECIES: hypothetical protein [unclassified Campylobacter]MCR8679338.1 hypothetical protein [Campylobacter sp. RM19072]MCR8696556.1 hypothetical protein [Campylobacter sp. RM19073]MEE3705230.1 hypothetical protein [Campylobacter sp. CX2-8023-23]MEE3744884.1 hypothetical protein [Campylobacter sp. CX2-4855-23]ARR01077.1 hypothetical protein CSUIS_1281 [Campylobacter sp. RM6137]
MKFLLCIFSFVLMVFAKCQPMLNSNININIADFSQDKISYSDGKNLYLMDKNYKITSTIEAKSDKINIIKFHNSNLIAGLDSGYAIQINPKGDKQILLDPVKTKIIDGITSINIIKDKIIFTLSTKYIVIYDTINSIYKKSNLNLNSKITNTHIINNILYITTFNRNLYELNLDNFKLNKISQMPNIPTAISSIDDEIIIGLIDGKIIYKNQIYQISNNQISKIKIYKNTIYISDWSSNLYIYDLNLNLKNSIKVGNDAILDMFIDKNSQIILWNSAIFSCNFGIE